MNRKYFFIALILLISVILLPSCAKKKVERIDPSKTVDLSGFWNDTDSRLVSEEMIKDCLERAWLYNFTSVKDKQPVVTVGLIRNKSMEHISVETFIKDIERAFINDGRVRVVASTMEKQGVRTERVSQQEFASEETKKILRNEIGADYIMLGTVNMIIDEDFSKQVRFYQVNLELIDIETNEKVWIGEKKIKKIVN